MNLLSKEQIDKIAEESTREYFGEIQKMVAQAVSQALDEQHITWGNEVCDWVDEHSRMIQGGRQRLLDQKEWRIFRERNGLKYGNKR